MMFSLLFLSTISIVYSTCDDPLLFPLKDSSEKTNIFNEFVFKFFYFRPTLGRFSLCLKSECIIFRSSFWHVCL